MAKRIYTKYLGLPRDMDAVLAAVKRTGAEVVRWGKPGMSFWCTMEIRATSEEMKATARALIEAGEELAARKPPGAFSLPSKAKETS